jgi:hypothetical protein
MKKWVLGMALAVWCMFATLPGSVWSAGLTIGDGGWVRVPGGASISLGCQSVVIQNGGTIDLGNDGIGYGTLTRCGRVQVDPGGNLYKREGKIIHNCTVASEIMLLLLE